MLYCMIAALAFSPQSRKTELWTKEQTEQAGLVWHGNSSSSSSHDLLVQPEGGYPTDFTWGNKDGVNYLTPSLNQHIPQVATRTPPLPPAMLLASPHPPRPSRDTHLPSPCPCPVLRLVLGPRLCVCAGRPHQDCARRKGHRHSAVGAARAQLRRRGLVPRRLAQRPVPVAAQALPGGQRHLLRHQQPVHGLQQGVQGGPLLGGRLDLLAAQRRPDLWYLRRAMRGPLALPERDHRRVRHHLGPRGHAEGSSNPGRSLPEPQPNPNPQLLPYHPIPTL